MQKFDAGPESVADAAWWGFDEVDATRAIQGAIDSGARTVIVPYVGKDWIVTPIRLRSHQEIVFEPGVSLVAKRGAFREKTDSMLVGREVTDVTLRGYGAALKMHKEDYAGTDYVKAEWRHGIQLWGVSDVRVLGLSVRGAGGDGIYVGPTWDARRIPCRDVLIKDCACEENYRQGISVVSVDGLRIDNCLLLRTEGTSPQSGLDLEPSDRRDLMSNVRISNCVSEANAGSGFIVSLSSLDRTSSDVSVLFESCLVRECGGIGLQARASGSPPKGLVEFRNCTVEGTKYAGVLALWGSAPELLLRFQNCKWRDVARKFTRGPLYLELERKAERSTTGGIEFSNCYLYDTEPRGFINVRGSGARGVFDVRGEMFLFNDRLTESAVDALVGDELAELKVYLRSGHD